MANVGVKLTIPFTVGTGQIVGQGNLPILWAMIGFDDMTDATPNWIDVTAKVRSFSISRTEGETGTATLTLDNRTRSFDPTFVSSPYYPNVRPMNRIWLRAQFSGETNDMFFGYAESYDQQWPGGGWSDALAVVTAADEFKVLSLTQLPLTNPPRSTYQDVVAFDNPTSYWTMDEGSSALTQPPAIVLQDTTAPAAGEDTFQAKTAIDLGGKAPIHRHHKPLVPKKRHYKVYDAGGNRVYPGPKPIRGR